MDIGNSAQMMVVHVTWTNMSYFPHFGWLVGCLGFNGPLRQYFSLYRAVSQRDEGQRRMFLEMLTTEDGRTPEITIL